MPERWLCGWKEIADYLGVSQHTARKYRGLPVYRNGSVRAKKEELDCWVGKRSKAADSGQKR